MESQSSSSAGYEGVRNFLKLQNLFGASTLQIYCRHFVTVWNHYFGASSGEWQNTKDFVDKKFISGGIGKEIYDACDEHQKRILRSGNISLWDLFLLLDVIKKLQNAVKNSTFDSNGGIKFLSEEKLDETKNLWAEVDYQSRVIVDYENYRNWMAKVIKTLEENGMSKEEIHTTAILLEKPCEVIPDLTDVGKLADKLKQDGNLAFAARKFEKALKFYTDAIEMDRLPEGLLGSLYSNRSACNLHLKQSEDAKFDAKCTITLRPSWFKGYLRLGRFYEEIDEFNAASQFYMLAEVLQPGNKEVADAINSCKTKRDNRQFNCSVFRNLQNTEKQLVSGEPKIIEMGKELVRQEEPFAMCREGKFYEMGRWGYPQDYKRAAELYSKAAEKGNAEGIFALACLTEEGKGVAKDGQKAIDMYVKVAAMSPFQDDPIYGRNTHVSSVFGAQSKLGDIYEEGKIVPRDVEVAISWYTKALENGCPMSPMDLGFIHLEQSKVPLAILHFKLASYRGNPRAMGQLAVMSMKVMKDPIVAQKWWKLAIHCGTVEIKKLENWFMKKELTPDFNPLDFRAEIKKELESTEFKDTMKEFDDSKYFLANKVWNTAFCKVDGIPEEAERELSKAMKNM